MFAAHQLSSNPDRTKDELPRIASVSFHQNWGKHFPYNEANHSWLIPVVQPIGNLGG